MWTPFSLLVSVLGLLGTQYAKRCSSYQLPRSLGGAVTILRSTYVPAGNETVESSSGLVLGYTESGYCRESSHPSCRGWMLIRTSGTLAGLELALASSSATTNLSLFLPGLYHSIYSNNSTNPP